MPNRSALTPHYTRAGRRPKEPTVEIPNDRAAVHVGGGARRTVPLDQVRLLHIGEERDIKAGEHYLTMEYLPLLRRQMAKKSEHEQTPAWHPPPESLTLGSDEVHVWRATLDRSAAALQRLLQTLSEDESARADRFYFQRDREHFIAARGLLRSLLGGYLSFPPEQLRFGYSPHGKPSLPGEWSELHFNLSHSHALALYAVTRGREVGIDLEYIRPELADEPIAERFFSAREAGALRSLPASLQPEGFFNCWTRKEAYIKARGEGLTISLDQFEVSLAPGEPAALLSVNSDPAEASRWSLRELAPGPGYVAAIAVEGEGWQIQCWEWPLER